MNRVDLGAKLMKVNPVNNTNKINPVKNVLKKTAKAALITAGTAAISAGAVVYMAKTGKLKPVEGDNKYLERTKAFLNDIVSIAENSELVSSISDSRIANYTKSIFSTMGDAVGNSKLYGKAKKSFGALKNIPSKYEYTIDTLKDNIERKFNPDKFSETINNSFDDIFLK